MRSVSTVSRNLSRPYWLPTSATKPLPRSWRIWTSWKELILRRNRSAVIRTANISHPSSATPEKISQEEYDALDKDEKKRYSLSDIVGKSGLEQTMDSVLQGEKGEMTFYVDSVGKVTDTVSYTEQGAGNDVYLTIDKDLQEYTYQILEEKIAGIVLSKLRNVMNYDPK